jgi:hypothetical protein
MLFHHRQTFGFVGFENIDPFNESLQKILNQLWPFESRRPKCSYGVGGKGDAQRIVTDYLAEAHFSGHQRQWHGQGSRVDDATLQGLQPNRGVADHQHLDVTVRLNAQFRA